MALNIDFTENFAWRIIEKFYEDIGCAFSKYRHINDINFSKRVQNRNCFVSFVWYSPSTNNSKIEKNLVVKNFLMSVKELGPSAKKSFNFVNDDLTNIWNIKRAVAWQDAKEFNTVFSMFKGLWSNILWKTSVLTSIYLLCPRKTLVYIWR